MIKSLDLLFNTDSWSP